jgi:hypothetical protein
MTATSLVKTYARGHGTTYPDMLSGGGRLRSKKPVAVRQGVRLGEDYVPVLGELVVLDAEKVIERGRDAVQDSLALGEDELALSDDMVHSLHNGCPHAGLDRIAETAHAVGDLRVVLDEPVAVEESGDLRAPRGALLYSPLSGHGLEEVSLDLMADP